MLTAADVRAARFTATKFRSGYEMVEVDALLARAARTLDHLEQGLTVESDGTPLLTPDDLLHARFSPTELTEGYFVDEVDDLLDEIIATLNTYIGRASRGEPLVQPAVAADDGAPAIPADADADAPADVEGGAEPTLAADDDVVGDSAATTASPSENAQDAQNASVTADAPAEHAAADVADVPLDGTAGGNAADGAPTDDASTDVGISDQAPAHHAAMASTAAPEVTHDSFRTEEPFSSAPVWSPPASTDVTPSWDVPAEAAAPTEPVAPTDDEPTEAYGEADQRGDDAPGADDAGVTTDDLSVTAGATDAPELHAPEPAAGNDAADELAAAPEAAPEAAEVPSDVPATAPDTAWAQPDEPAAVPDTAWAQPEEPTSPWAAPEPVRWTAPEDATGPEQSPQDTESTTDTAATTSVDAAADASVAASGAASEAVSWLDSSPGDDTAPDGEDAAPDGDSAATAEDPSEAAGGPAPWEPGFVAPAAPVATPDWGFSAAAEPAADAWEASQATPLGEAAPDERPEVEPEAEAEQPAADAATPVEPVAEPDDDLADESLLASAEESPWASLDGDEPVALDLDSEVRDAESADAEVPAWLTDAQPEMETAAPADPTTEAPATDAASAEAPTRVSAFAFAAQGGDTDVDDLDAPTVLMEAVDAPADTATADAPAPSAGFEPDAAPVAIASVPVAAPTFDSPAALVESPGIAADTGHVAPADALDSQGFLRQLTFARATSTGAAKDTITLVDPDGRVFSAVGVRKTPEGLVVDLG